MNRRVIPWAIGPIAFLSVLVGLSAARALTGTNPDFEDGNLNGWTPVGPVTVETNAFGETAAFGTHFALLVPEDLGTSTHPSQCPASLEQVVGLQAGERLRGAAFYKDFDGFGDFVEVRIVETATVLFFRDDSQPSTGWEPWEFIAPTAGSYTVRAVAVQGGDCWVPPVLGLDVVPPADLSIAVSSNPLVPMSGQAVTHKARVRNIQNTGIRKTIAGFDATNVVMTLNMATYSDIVATVVPTGWNCTVTGQHAVCTAPVLGIGKSATFTFASIAAATPDGRPPANGTVTADNPDPNLNNNTAVAQGSLP